MPVAARPRPMSRTSGDAFRASAEAIRPGAGRRTSGSDDLSDVLPGDGCVVGEVDAGAVGDGYGVEELTG